MHIVLWEVCISVRPPLSLSLSTFIFSKRSILFRSPQSVMRRVPLSPRRLMTWGKNHRVELPPEGPGPALGIAYSNEVGAEVIERPAARGRGEFDKLGSSNLLRANIHTRTPRIHPARQHTTCTNLLYTTEKIPPVHSSMRRCRYASHVLLLLCGLRSVPIPR